MDESNLAVGRIRNALGHQEQEEEGGVGDSKIGRLNLNENRVGK